MKCPCGGMVARLRRTGGYWRCLSTAEWCEANPLPGREAVPRSTPEWFEILR